MFGMNRKATTGADIEIIELVKKLTIGIDQLRQSIDRNTKHSYDELLLDDRIENSGITGYSLQAMRSNGIKTIRDLTSFTKQGLNALHGIGPAITKDIEDKLRIKGLSLSVKGKNEGR